MVLGIASRPDQQQSTATAAANFLPGLRAAGKILAASALPILLFTGVAAAVAAPALVPASGGKGIAANPVRLPVAVFGRDDRRIMIGRNRQLRDRIGLLYHRATKSVCTAFCVGRDLVATAGHCVVGTSHQPGIDPDQLRFRPDSKPGLGVAVMGARTGTAGPHILTGASQLNTRPPINATSDWAVLRLEKPVCPAAGLIISRQSAGDVIQSATQGLVYHVAYHRDLAQWKLAVARPCMMLNQRQSGTEDAISRDFDNSGDLLLHMCDTESASSGSPLLIDGENGPEVVGINVGTYVRSRVIMHDGEIVQRIGSEVIANTALLARPLALRIARFAEAVLLDKPAEIAEVQSRLARKGFFTGVLDGDYGPVTRDAIAAYEASLGLPVVGLATRQLLDRLSKPQSANVAR